MIDPPASCVPLTTSSSSPTAIEPDQAPSVLDQTDV
jgi:hypothetical protein